jgi:hypothetical protein
LDQNKYILFNNSLWLMKILLHQSNIEIQPRMCHNDFIFWLFQILN